ncbi:hypothetical protein MK079_03780 [Candidatus Gracilibacteria bacterium]|nr:hypothetical protein [Candidatus Gracilibacteria bacterium]
MTDQLNGNLTLNDLAVMFESNNVREGSTFKTKEGGEVRILDVNQHGFTLSVQAQQSAPVDNPTNDHLTEV